MNCKICGSKTILFNKSIAPVEGYVCNSIKESVKQRYFKFDLLFCENCNFLYHKEIKGAKKYLDILYKNHLSTFHINNDFISYLNTFVENILLKVPRRKGRNVLEIGCNDGYILSVFKKQDPGINLYGVEPSEQFKEKWKERNINVYNNYLDIYATNYFSSVTFDIIYFRHVFEHIFDPVSFFELVNKICNNETLLVIESPYLLSILENNRIDNFGYSHANYFSILSINKIIYKYGFKILDFEKVDMDGGSFVAYVKKNNDISDNLFNDTISSDMIAGFFENIENIKKKFSNLKKKYNKDEIIGYGAGAKGQHLIHLFKLKDIIRKVYDDTPEYHKKFIPGTEIEILNSDKIINKNIKAVINLVPTHYKIIKNKISKDIKFIDFINK